MHYGHEKIGQVSIGRVPAMPVGHRHKGEVAIPSVGGYADIFDGVLEIRIDGNPFGDAHKRFCKPVGFADQGYRED